MKITSFGGIVSFAILCCLTIRCRADQAVFDVGTEVTGNWLIDSSGISNAPPFPYLCSPSLTGVTISSSGDGNGYFLLGTNLSTFDGYWIAKSSFYLPANVMNVSLIYTNLGFDDAGVFKVNDKIVASVATTATSSTPLEGQMVFVEGATSAPWPFIGPNFEVSGVVTNGFILGATNTLSAIVNNTDSGPSGNLTHGMAQYDSTVFAVNATLIYDAVPTQSLTSVALYPGIKFSGIVGSTYEIQYATNLSTGTWMTLTNLVLPESPYLFFDSDSATSQLSRFYRIVNQTPQ